MPDVIVIGGGISGLTAAWDLHAKGMDVLVLEASETPGGNVQTIQMGDYRMEAGPSSFMGSSENLWRLVEELQIEELSEAASSVSDNRYIYRDGRLMALPLGPMSFLTTKLLSLRAKLRLMMEPFIPNGAKEHDTAWEYFIRRFGVEAATFIMGPFISGVYAGDPKMLGARAAFPKFWNFERNSGSMILGAIKFMREKKKRLALEGKVYRKGLYSFDGGLGTLTNTIADRLGQRVIAHAPVSKLGKNGKGFEVMSSAGQWHAPNVVVATPPHITADIAGDVTSGIVKPLREIPMSPVSVVHWAHEDDPRVFPNGFGYLMPRIYDLRVLGTIFGSNLFMRRAPEGKRLFTSFYGGMLDPGAMNLSDEELSGTLRSESSRVFGASLDRAEILSIMRYPGGIPQLLPDHPERIQIVQREVEKVPGMVLAGNYLTGVGIEHAVASGYTAADAITKLHSGS